MVVVIRVDVFCDGRIGLWCSLGIHSQSFVLFFFPKWWGLDEFCSRLFFSHPPYGTNATIPTCKRPKPEMNIRLWRRLDSNSFLIADSSRQNEGEQKGRHLLVSSRKVNPTPTVQFVHSAEWSQKDLYHVAFYSTRLHDSVDESEREALMQHGIRDRASWLVY